MACFLVTAAEAVVVTAAQKAENKKDNAEHSSNRIPMSRKLIRDTKTKKGRTLRGCRPNSVSPLLFAAPVRATTASYTLVESTAKIQRAARTIQTKTKYEPKKLNQ